MELIVSLVAAAWLVTELEPLQEFLEGLYCKNKILDQFLNVATCFKCLTFWLVLGFTLNPFHAVFAAMAAKLYERFTSR